MAFITEDVPDEGPETLADEHQRLAAWMAENRVGVTQYLCQRMVDPSVPAALYYIEGLGMGHGQRFAIVCGDDIYMVSVNRPEGIPSTGAAAGYISEVSLPEFAALDRGAIKELLSGALSDYFEGHTPLWVGMFGTRAGSLALDWTTARWVVRPRKYSLLYWRTEFAKRWPRIRTRCLHVWDRVSSPLAATLAFAGFAWFDSRWPMILAGVWLALRLLQYDSVWRLSEWALGQKKFRDPLHTFRILERMQNPPPLGALEVQVERMEGEPTMCIVRVVNRSFVPVRYVSIGANSLAELLAPGFQESLQREKPLRAFNDTMKELQSRFPTMTKKWLWPRRSFSCSHNLLQGFPLASRKREVQAEAIFFPRFLSGEPRLGPCNFLLSVEYLF